MKKRFVIKNLSNGKFLTGYHYNKAFFSDGLQYAILFVDHEIAEEHIETFKNMLDGEVLQIVEIFIPKDYFTQSYLKTVKSQKNIFKLFRMCWTAKLYKLLKFLYPKITSK